ncbi:MAG: TlpA family protein disulfide reductase [Aquaticitalea sp.]
MKFIKKHRNNIIFLVFVAILIIPQTRQPIQILLHKGLALFSPTVIDYEDREVVSDYNWSLIDENGQAYNFKEAKGKVVLINFWATWCPPCIAEMPSMEKLYQDYKDDVVFLFVSEENQETISKFKEKRNYNFGVFSSVTKHPEIFETNSIPKTYILDKKGKIAINKSGAADWNSDAVRHLLDDLLESK